MMLARPSLMTCGVLAAALVGACAGPVFAVDHVWLDNGGLGGSLNSLTHWDSDGDTVPGEAGEDDVPNSDDFVIFNNGASSAYTVSLTGDINTDYHRVVTDKVIYDLAGHKWLANGAETYNYGDGSRIAGNQGEIATVTFSSSVAAVDPLVDNLYTNSNSSVPYTAWVIGVGVGTGAQATVNIDK